MPSAVQVCQPLAPALVLRRNSLPHQHDMHWAGKGRVSRAGIGLPCILAIWGQCTWQVGPSPCCRSSQPTRTERPDSQAHLTSCGTSAIEVGSSSTEVRYKLKMFGPSKFGCCVVIAAEHSVTGECAWVLKGPLARCSGIYVPFLEFRDSRGRLYINDGQILIPHR